MNSLTGIYAANVAELEDEALYCAAYRKVTGERRTKTDRFCLMKDKRLSLGAELLLINGLEQMGLSIKDMSYHYGANGKPYLKGRQDIYFNLSHSGEMALCAISSEEIGCDVEKISGVPIGTARRFFHKEEYEKVISQKTVEASQEMFFRLWTLKESFLKLTGMGMRLPMKSFCIHIGADGIFVEQEQNYRTCYFQELEICKDYKCSVCGFAAEIGQGSGVPFELVHLSDILTMEGSQ